MAEPLRRRILPVLLGLLVALQLMPAPAAAAADDPAGAPGGDLGISVRVGYGNARVTGPWQPVAVHMSPQRPVRASLVVSARTPEGRQTVHRDIELRAGATAVYRFVLPTGAVSVTVQEEGRPDRTVRVPSPDPTEAATVIGLLGFRAEPPPVTDPVLLTNATWAPVDPEWLTLGAAALRTLSGLVVDEATLAGLDATRRRTLATAVAEGMDLVVAATEPGPVDLDGLVDGHAIEVSDAADDAGLRSLHTSDPAWAVPATRVWPDGDPDTTVAVTVPRGRGRVSVVTVLPGPGPVAGATRLWSLLALGRPVNQSDRDVFVAGLQTQSAGRLALALADDAASEPEVPWLAVFFTAYILTAGPVVGVVLARRRRRELAWVAIPVVTVVFTVTAAIAVTGARPLREQHATLRWWLDGAGQEIALAGVRAPSAGVRTLRLPGSGWLPRTIATGTGTADVHTSPDGTSVALSLQSLAFGGVIAHRPLEQAPPLTLDARVTGRDVTVEVRNTGTERLDAVEVRVGAARRPVGSLDAGATTTVTFPGDVLPEVAAYTDLTAAAGPGAVADVILSDGVLAPEPGIVWAVGTRRSASTDVVAVGQRPRPDRGAELTPLAVDRGAPLTGGMLRSGTFTAEPSGVVRWRLPAELAGRRVGDRLGRQIGLQVWDWQAETWVDRDAAFPGGVGEVARVLSPTGELYVRVRGGGAFNYAASSVGAPGRGDDGTDTARGDGGSDAAASARGGRRPS